MSKNRFNVTPIQANNYDKIIDIIKEVKIRPLSKSDVGRILGYKPRQADYYYNALISLGICLENSSSQIYMTPEVLQRFNTTEIKKILRQMLVENNVLEIQRDMLANSTFLESVIKRRKSSVKALEEFINEEV